MRPGPALATYENLLELPEGVRGEFIAGELDVAPRPRPRTPDPWDTLPIDVAPDWIGEVLSPSNAAHDRVTKRRLYAKHQVPITGWSTRRRVRSKRCASRP